MSPRFLAFMPFIFEWEGGYDNDPDDPGGETKYGIDKRSHPQEDIKNLTRERASEIYWTSYWSKIQGDNMPPLVGEVLMNIAVNCGYSRAAKWLQVLVGAEPDGKIGPNTVRLANFGDPKLLAKMLLDKTESHYRSIANGRLAKFLKGWLNRNNALRSYLHV